MGDLHDVSVLYSILQHLRNNKNVLEIKVCKEIDQPTLMRLREILQLQPGHSGVCVHRNKESGITFSRVDRADIPLCSFATEESLSKSWEVASKMEASDSFPACTYWNQTTCSASVVNFDFWLNHRSCEKQFAIPQNCAMIDERLPVPDADQREHLSKWLSSSTPVAIVSNTPAGGKRNEIASLILEYTGLEKRACRVIFVLQDEVEVPAMARQISDKRREEVGNTIGYRLQINSQISDMSNMVICTAQTLLQSLLTEQGQHILAELTLLIVDGVNRRTEHMNFLISLLREKLHLYPTLKLLLLSSNTDVERLTNYFGKPKVLHVDVPLPTSHYVPSEPFGVKYDYLDTILDQFSTNVAIRTLKAKLETTNNPLMHIAQLQVRYTGSKRYNHNTTRMLDELLQNCWFADDMHPFKILIDVLKYNKHMVDYQHSNSRMTALMISAAKGSTIVVDELLTMGANPCLVGIAGYTAMDWCRDGEHNPCWLRMYAAIIKSSHEHPQSRHLCRLYHQLHNPYTVDHDLLMDVLTHICTQRAPGKILVMLPDFPDVLECFELLRRSPMYLSRMLFVEVYNRMLTEEEAREEPLRTNSKVLYEVILMAGPLVEMLPTVHRIHYVVDIGLNLHPAGHYAKGMCLDGACIATEQMTRELKWLAERHLFCLYVRDEVESPKYCNDAAATGQTEMVLQALLCRSKAATMSVEQFFDQSLSPVHPGNVERSLELLRQIGAIEQPLHVPTSLGRMLANLNIDVHLGKTLMYSVLFKCMDPVITIVAALKVGNPFIEPLNPLGESEIMGRKTTLHSRSYSDCVVLLRLYHMWSQCKVLHTDRDMVQKFHLKLGFMEAIVNARVELMSVMRAVGIVKCGRMNNTELLNQNSRSWSLVKACLTAGFYPKLAMVDQRRQLLTVRCGTEVYEPHPLSVAVLPELPSRWVIYAGKQELPPNIPWSSTEEKCIPRAQLLEITVISDWDVLLLCGVDRLDSNETDEAIGYLPTQNTFSGQDLVEFIVDKQILFRLTRCQYDTVRWLRRELGLLFRRFIDNPHETIAQEYTNLLVQHIGDILNKEDTGLRIANVNSIDMRPKLKMYLPMGTLWNYGAVLAESTQKTRREQTKEERQLECHR